MKSIFLFIIVFIITSSCSKRAEPAKINNVLMLQVDFLTNTFKGGKEFTFTNPATTFTIAKDYKAPSDIGYLKLSYQELNEPLFDGSLIWAGTGEMKFPQNLVSPKEFDTVASLDIINPTHGFENIFSPTNIGYDFSQAWLSVQKLAKVRAYLSSNPDATVKLFLYTPSVGALNQADANWIIFLKN